MGKKRRSIHSPKFANRVKYAALKNSSEPSVEILVQEAHVQEIILQPEEPTEVVNVNPEVLLFNEPEPVNVKEEPKPKRKARKPTTRKRNTRKKATKKEVA